MKKVIFILITLLFITGCNVDYNLEIYNENYNEEILINGVDVTNEMVEWNIPVFANTEDIAKLLTIDQVPGVTYYKKVNTDNNYFYIATFKMEDYYKSYFAVNSYDFFAVYYDDTDESGEKELITISTNAKFLPFEKHADLDNVTVKIKTNHRVYSHNADMKEDYTYIWNITKENYENKPIQIRLIKNKYVLNYNDRFTKYIYIILGIVGVLLIIFGAYFLKLKKANQI